MGMFDTLICHYPLANPADQGLVFQTKSLECCNDNYVIDEQGRLMLVSSEDSPPEIVENIDQEIIFKTAIQHENGEHSWLEYRACYIDGQLQWIRQSTLYKDHRLPNHATGMEIAGCLQDPERIFYVATITVMENGNEREIHRLFSVPEDNIESACVVGEATTYESFSGDAEWNGAAGSWFFSEELTIMCEQMRKVPPECLGFLKELLQDSTPDQQTIDLVESLLQGKEI